MVLMTQIGRKLARKRATINKPHQADIYATALIRDAQNRTNLVAHTTSAQPNQALLALLQQWREEDDAMTPDEAAQADEDLTAFKDATNANREATNERVIYP